MAHRPVCFFITGVPAPQGSKRLVQPRGAKRPVMIEMSPHHRAWRRDVAAHAQIAVAEHRLRPMQCGVSLTLRFYCPRPQRLTRPFPRVDVDKLVRATADGLVEGGLLADDDLVTHLVATKAYAAPGGAIGCHVFACENAMSHGEAVRAPARLTEE